MRPDTELAVRLLHEKDQTKLRRDNARYLENIESRLRDETPILGVISAGFSAGEVRPGQLYGDQHDVGVVAVSGYGMHWAGIRETYDWSWDEVRTYGFKAGGAFRGVPTLWITFRDDGQFAFRIGEKRESAESFMRAVDERHLDKPKL